MPVTITTLSRTLIAFAAISLIAIGVAVIHMFMSNENKAPDFRLTDQSGAPFALSSQRGHPVAIFFGYAHCADACPLVLAHLARVIRAPQSPRDAKVVFVTVDPERDSPSALQRYLRAFDPSFVGVTGTLAELQPVYDAYHIARIPAPHASGASLEIEHETAVFIIDRSGAMRNIVPGDDDITSLAKALASAS